MKLYFEEEQGACQEILQVMERAAEMATALEGFTEEERERTQVSLTFVGLEEIHQLNRTYRQVDSPTDVLSFPQFDDLNDLPEEGEIVLGDVVICTEKAREQAEEFGHSYERELVYLFVHSVLHLLGYDHMEEEDKREMRQREEQIMKEVGLTREDKL
ncbi:MAG: rRNA maturation RNase YbeY [Firmicutes bacterium]|nr:rRNA maturation RNase YbeY [Bacillota bacterium]